MADGGKPPSSSVWLPEESFQSWGSYGRALRASPKRFRNRVFARAEVHDEVTRMKARSANDMKKTLTWWDLMWFGIGAVVGAGIFVITGVEAKTAAGPAIIISYALAGFSAMLSVFCYTEFAVEIPVAGGSFAYLRVELGDFVAFIGAGNIVLEYVIGGAAVARGWTSYFASLILNDSGDKLRIHTNLASGYNNLDPIAVGILLITGAIAMWSTKGTSYLNWIASVVNMFIITFIIIAGLAHADTRNLTSDFLPFGVRGIFNAASVLFFAYLGFDAVSTMAEEVKDPGRDIPIGLLGSMSICTFLYIMMALTLSLMVPYATIDEGAPFSMAFSAVGWDWAKYIVALGALKGITTVLLVSAVGQARYLTHIARAHLIPPWFGLVSSRTKTPANATATMVLASAAVAFFTELAILGNLLSMSSLFIFFLVALALLVRRYYVPGETTHRHAALLAAYLAVIVAASIGIAAAWGTSTGSDAEQRAGWWAPYAVCGPAWFLATLALHVTVPAARRPTRWGVPLVPWIPSLSVALNIFLLGSLDKASFIRFGYWTALMLVYYVFFGLHASYDTATGRLGDVEGKLHDEEGEAPLPDATGPSAALPPPHHNAPAPAPPPSTS